MLDIINKISWSIASVMLLFCGIYYTISLKFPQFKIRKMIKGFKNNSNSKISPFKILSMTLGGKIGVGSLAGIALAINIGGIGTIFWIWIFSILTAPNAYVESALGVIFKEKDIDYYKGGPSFYIDKGLKKKNLGKTYAIIVIFSYILGFLTIQANTIAISFTSFINIDKIIIGIILATITLFTISKGIESISNVSSKIVPIMGIIYLIVGIFVIIKNYSIIPTILLEIIKAAFNFKSLGTGVITSMIIGLQRGIFSNEAGLGTGAIASGASEDDNAEEQGFIQIIGIYFTSLIICTTTAILILTSNYKNLNLTNINGIEITQHALNFHLGNIGDIILSITIFLFAFSTIITVYYYGESNLKYLLPDIKAKGLLILKIAIIILIIYGSIASPNIIWDIIDIFVAVLAIINVYAIYKLRGVIEKR